MSNKRLIYKVYSDCLGIRQQTTSVNINKCPFYTQIYEYATMILHDRFKNYGLNINHAGLTVMIYEIGA